MADPSSTTIVVVDDNQDLVDLYTSWLTPTYTVRTAYDGDEALTQIDETVDIVLLDRRMPGLSGEEVLETIRTRDLDCRVALVTSVTPDFDILDLGFDDYIQKPVTETTLHDLVESLLTRMQYNEQVREYASLVTKQTTLQAEKDPEELREHSKFEQLQAQIADRRNEVEILLDDFSDDDFVAAFRDIA